MGDLVETFVELVRRASTELPADVEAALRAAREREDPDSAAASTLETILQNVALARASSTPVCQDTGVPIFYVYHPQGLSTRQLRAQIEAAVAEATRRAYLRPNAVDSLTGRNSGNNVGIGFPTCHFNNGLGKERNGLGKERNGLGKERNGLGKERNGLGKERNGLRKERMRVDLLLKGGGSENVGTQYKLPYEPLKAGRDLEGVRRVVLDAVYQAQGQGCAPGVLGITIGGDRGTGYVHAKEQFFRPLDDVNPLPELAALEERLLRECNELGIGPMGCGGKTTLLGVKIGVLHRLPACHFVSIAYMCWACRRARLEVLEDKTTFS